jgi:hypothetical protein
MTTKLNTFDAIELIDSDLEHVIGGSTIVGVVTNPILLKAEQELATMSQSPIHLSPFAPPHTAIPH